MLVRGGTCTGAGTYCTGAGTWTGTGTCTGAGAGTWWRTGDWIWTSLTTVTGATFRWQTHDSGAWFTSHMTPIFCFFFFLRNDILKINIKILKSKIAKYAKLLKLKNCKNDES